MSFYPPEVQERNEAPRNACSVIGANASGKDASFVCGSFVSFSFLMEPESKKIASAGFQSNGCGYMIAAADVLADAVRGKHLADLHGLDKNELRAKIADELGIFPPDRLHCEDTCIAALRSAFADYRTRQIEEFQGEKALICTCFGVSEETIEKHIELKSLKTVEEVTLAIKAGSGCGSCRMLIQEIIDSR